MGSGATTDLGDAEAVVLHYWRWDVKGRIVGADLDWSLRRIERISGAGGAALVALGLILVARSGARTGNT